MPEDIDFADLAAISRIGSDTIAEKFGGVINASFFEASNVLGTLKQKGLIDFSISFPGQNAVTLTELGKDIISKAEEKASEPIDYLDVEILTQLYNGKKSLAEIAESVNVTQKDLAFHIYKMAKQQYANYEFRNGKIELSLTDRGFVEAKKSSNSADNKVTMQKSQAQQSDQTDQSGSAPQEKQPRSDAEVLKEIDMRIGKMKMRKKTVMAIAIVIVIIAIILIVMKVGMIKI